MRRGDAAVSSIVGAIVVLGILGTALLYVNAVYVPRQGAAMEVATNERAEASLLSLATSLSASASAPLVHDVPLRGERATPPLLAGVVLSPARAEGSLSLDSGPSMRIWVLVDTPVGGVPANDPMREAQGDLMRVYLLGNATRGQAVGALVASTGGAYLDASRERLEAGALISDGASGSALVAPPSLVVARGGTPGAATTTVSWVLPLLGGSSTEVSGGDAAQVALTPGPTSALGGGTRVHNLTIEVNTTTLAAWQRAFTGVVGSNGYVNVTSSGPVDNGTVQLDIAPPPGTAAGVRAVELRMWAVRHEVSLADRST